MSAHMVDDADLIRLANLAIDVGAYIPAPPGWSHPHYMDCSDADRASNGREFGQALVNAFHAANVASLEARYPGRNEGMYDPTPPSYRRALTHTTKNAKALFALIATYEYQCCETNDWETSWAYRTCSRMVRDLGRHVLDLESLTRLRDTA